MPVDPRLSRRAALRDAVEDVDETDEVRGGALEALGAWSDESTAELISELYEIGSPLLRLSAIRAMGRNASEGWLELLIYHFDDEDADIRAAAAQATSLVGTASSADVTSDLKAAVIEIMDTLKAVGLWKGSA